MDGSKKERNAGKTERRIAASRRRKKKTVSLNIIYFSLLLAHTAFLFIFTGNRSDPLAWIIFCIFMPIFLYLPIAAPSRLAGLFIKRDISARALAAIEAAGSVCLLLITAINIYMSFTA